MLKEEQQKRVEELRYKFRTEGSPVSDIIAIIDTLQAELDKPTAETYERFINKYLFIRGMYWGSHTPKDSAIISASGGDGTERFFKDEVECFLDSNPEYDGRDFYILL